MYWFTADEHFNHENILKLFVYRPFKTIEEMNAILIKRHNERVKVNDTVFHLGDFKVTNQGENAHELKQKLNGNHVFIVGNHDKNNGCNSPIKHCVINTYGKTVLLIHRPEDAEIIMAHGGIDLAFVGHVHEKWVIKDRMINVGVDAWNFYPVDAKQILKFYYKRNEDYAAKAPLAD